MSTKRSAVFDAVRVHGVTPDVTLVGRRILALATVVALLLGFGVMTSAPVAADATGTLSIIAGTGQVLRPRRNCSIHRTLPLIRRAMCTSPIRTTTSSRR
jgi:uncharacterized BrkB/YihY/UPF0761 family membrane protein